MESCNKLRFERKGIESDCFVVTIASYRWLLLDVRSLSMAGDIALLSQAIAEGIDASRQACDGDRGQIGADWPVTRKCSRLFHGGHSACMRSELKP